MNPHPYPDCKMCSDDQLCYAHEENHICSWCGAGVEKPILNPDGDLFCNIDCLLESGEA